MRAFAITGIVTAPWISSIFVGSAIRATPPAARMSAGTRSIATTAAAPAVTGELHRAHHERVGTAGREPDHQRPLVDPAEAREPLLRRARHHLATEVEQHEEVA